jgi:histidyl-tRNA synthetase
MFRYDKPQKGRYRQFHQIDIEVFGEKDPAIDAEIVEMADFLLKELNVFETETLVNSIGCQQCRPSYLKDLRSQAERVKDSLCKDCQRKVTTNPLRIFDCKVESCREAAQTFPEILSFLCRECDEHFTQFQSYLDLYEISYRIDPRLVRGLDYYTKTAFEVVSPKLGAQNSVLGGGRYDDMTREFGGPDLCGIGFAVGMERLISIIPFTEAPVKFVYVAFLGEKAKRKGMAVVRFLRKQGLECLIEYKERNLKNHLSRANKLKTSWVLILGETELVSEKYVLKNMETGVQIETTMEKIPEHIKLIV